MDRQTKILKKRQQRHSRESVARIGHFISSYVQHKYTNIYVEAKQFYDELREIYPHKHDLKKTAQYEVWKKQVERKETSTKDMELKIKLMSYKSKTTTTTTATTTTTTTDQTSEESTAALGISEDTTRTTSDQATASEESTAESTAALGISEDTTRTTSDQATASEESTAESTAALGISEDTTRTTSDQATPSEESTAALGISEDTAQPTPMDQDIWPSLDLQIPPEIIDQIIADLNMDSVLADLMEEQTEIDSDFENLGADIIIDGQYSLEDELTLY